MSSCHVLLYANKTTLTWFRKLKQAQIGAQSKMTAITSNSCGNDNFLWFKTIKIAKQICFYKKRVCISRAEKATDQIIAMVAQENAKFTSQTRVLLFVIA